MFRNPTTDLIVVLVIVLLIFGPKRLPQLGRQLGQGMREFRDGITGRSKDSDGEGHAEIEQASTAAPAPGAPLRATPRETAPAPTAERDSPEVAAPEPRR
jgi:sec-independent protein translocase protein TatA